MKFLSPAFAGFMLLLAASPCFAQMSMSGGSPGGGAPQPPAKAPTQDVAPPGLPGAGQTPIATGPVMQKPAIADPTQALFAAVNAGDYNAAQDAISRGANLAAQDAFGETPLDLAVALNHSDITFLILQARNEDGGDEPISPGPAFPPGSTAGGYGHHNMVITPATDSMPLHAAAPVMGNDPGTPDPEAGFLGFGAKN